jgi:hypothetical protein
MISKEDMKELFILIIPLIKAAKGMKVIIMGPMPRYLIAKCCDNPGHVTNRNTDCYIDGMIQGIRDVYSWINSTIFLRRIKDVKTFNPTHALGFSNYDVNIDTIPWTCGGRIPSTLPPAAYNVLAEKLASLVDDILNESAAAAGNSDSQQPQKKRQATREPWIVASEPVAKRLGDGQGQHKRQQKRGHEAGRGRRGHSRGGHSSTMAPTALTVARPTGATLEAKALAQGAGEEGPSGAAGAAGKRRWPSGPRD